MTTIPLDRRFYEWRRDADTIDLAFYRSAAGFSDGLLGWQELLARRRVVLLAEAGSGKTEELIEQARLQTIAGKYSFYATVQDIGRDGLEKTLRVSERERLKAWKNGTGPCWFFIDSVDEAKLNNIKLERALRELADAIAGAEQRSHIILSGRHTDWEFTRDVRTLNVELPLPDESKSAPVPALDELIRGILRDERPPAALPAETPIIVVMDPLDPERVRAYATAKNVTGINDLLDAIHAANMWNFARRPLDLDWMVQYWGSHKRLGSFTEMIEASLTMREREVDPQRARKVSLDSVRARQGLERIGAALVFGRQTTIAIPDIDSHADLHASVSIDEILPDWVSGDRMHLLSLPAFDPATFGRARLHNDNEGVVRGYLAARWLWRLRQANLSERRLHDLLFSCTYGIELVKPSMLETAAWLSLWEESVANEVIRRAPFLLFTAGDPAGLPGTTRRCVLLALIERIRQKQEIPLFDFNSLMRFSQPDIKAPLHDVWNSDQFNADIRPFVLRLIWAGKLRDCADIAEAASFGRFPDASTAITAGWALLATGNNCQKSRYAKYIKQNCSSIPTTVVWNAIDDLFPQLIGVNDLIAILTVIQLGDKESDGFNLVWNGADLAARLPNAEDLTQLIEGLLSHLELENHDPYSDDDSSRDAHYATMLGAAAAKLLELSPQNVAPGAAIEAILRIGDHRYDRTQHRIKKGKDAVQHLNRTPERRRAAFWRAADFFKKHKTPSDRPLIYFYEIKLKGWGPELQVDDIDWLLEDAPCRELKSDGLLAIHSALILWATMGEQENTLLSRISDVASKDTEMHAAFTEWMAPRIKSADEIRNEKENAQYMLAAQKKRSKEDQSWIDFIVDIRSNPGQLYNLAATTNEGVDYRIFNLWKLLRQATRSSSQYGISSIVPIDEIIGRQAADAFATGLLKIWREWKPTLPSAHPPGERNSISFTDSICLTGVSIEAASNPKWAILLTEENAIRAAEFAMLEIGGYPEWIRPLAEAWPRAVKQVLTNEVGSDLDNPAPGIHYQTLEYVYRGPEILAHLISLALWLELQARPELNQLALRPLLPILVLGLSGVEREKFLTFCINRFLSGNDPQTCAQYLGAAYVINAVSATDALVEKLDRLVETDKTSLVERVLPQIFGTRWPRPKQAVASLNVPTLERLVQLAFRIVRIEEDRDRANKGVYSPDARDEAEEARSLLFSTLINTPGSETFAAITRLIEMPGFPVPASRLRSLAYDRAAKDAEATAWSTNEAQLFEEKFEIPPRTGSELQRVALTRLDDLQHDLLHGDFQQGKTLQKLPNEPAVQNWIADRLRLVQGNAYSIERESHVADEKEPDLRCRAKASDACVSIEIKIANSWSLQQLEDALEIQLCEQYLRSRQDRHGILLLVHRTRRSKGWVTQDGKFLNFHDLVQYLEAIALNIRNTSSTGPQPEIAVIDVSSCAAPVRKRKSKKKTSI